MQAELPLGELRVAHDITQEQLATILGVKQTAVSRMERRRDMYISSLSKTIEAMGGKLEIRAVFPDGTVQIKQFSGAGGD
jgi:transcriptional regulator with XRE-family HTH domain